MPFVGEQFFYFERRSPVVLLNLIEGARGVLPSPEQVGTEELITNLVLWLKLGVELVGILLIGIGVLVTSIRTAGVIWRPLLSTYGRTRVTLSRFLALGLEFQLAADIIGTAVAPSWTQIGKLAAIAVIRTGLNYFLAREIGEEVEEMNGPAAGVESKSEA
jgi:uncharacterized membrane protein